MMPALMGRIVAALLSLTWPGLGQIFNRQFAKGLVLCLIQLALASFFVFFEGIPLSILTLVMAPLALWAGWDAYRVAALRAFYRTFE